MFALGYPFQPRYLYKGNQVPQQLFWGVWIPREGWLKKNGEVVAFDHVEVADQTAARVGNGATVYYVDNALADLEFYFLEREAARARKTIWRKLETFARKLFRKE